MKCIHFRPLLSAAAALAAISFTGQAFAQYAWIDEKGVKQFSDMPPPASVPANRIVKQSRDNAALPVAPRAPGGVVPPAAGMSLAEKDADFRKRRAEQAEKEKKAADAARTALDKTRNCERTREYSRALESGERMARTDKNGERSFLTDEQRAQELHETRRVLADCK